MQNMFAGCEAHGALRREPRAQGALRRELRRRERCAWGEAAWGRTQGVGRMEQADSLF